nr:solute carrier family 13 member 5-like [Parasteatoda tepidariorum]
MKNWKNILGQLDRKLFIYIVSLILPFILLPLALSPLQESRCSYAFILTASYWILEPVPIYVSGLLPVFLLPLLGLLSSPEVCANYMKEITMLVIGSILVSQAVEESKLHERISLKILLLIGTDLQWLLLGVMLSTMFMSMWMINTATTAMMLPIVEALLKKISASLNRSTESAKVIGQSPILETSLTENKCIHDPRIDDYSGNEYQNQSQIRIVFLISICYSANIGGTGTLTGTGSNFLLKGLMEEHFPESDEINFATWMIYSIPGMLLCTVIAWFYLWKIYLRKSKYNPTLKQELFETISKRYEELGPLSYCEKVVSTLFVILLLLWLTRDPKVMNGWSKLVGFDKKVGDVVPAIAISFLLFLLPSDIKKFENGPILKFEKASKQIPWGLILIFGGSYSLASAAQVYKNFFFLRNPLSFLKHSHPKQI